MHKRTTQSKLTIYRRHAGRCPLFGEKKSRILDGCECPLWCHGKVRGQFIQKSLDTKSPAVAIMRRDDLLRGKPDDDPTPGGGIHVIAKTPAAEITLEHAAKDFLDSKGRKAHKTVSIY